jgi:hypothetical protein
LGFVEEQRTRAVLVEVVMGPKDDWRRPVMWRSSVAEERMAQKLLQSCSLVTPRGWMHDVKMRMGRSKAVAGMAVSVSTVVCRAEHRREQSESECTSEEEKTRFSRVMPTRGDKGD